MVSYDGRFRGELSCPMGRKYYPFDAQVCNITVLGSFVEYSLGDVFPSHDDDKNKQSTTLAILQSYKDKIYETKIFNAEMSTNEWQLNPTDDLLASSLARPIVKRTSEAQSLTFQLFLKRNSWPLVWTLIVPPVILSTTTVVGLFIGCSSDERFSFGSAVVVTLSVLIGGLHEKLSAGSDGYPLLAWLYLGLFFSVILATTMSRVPCALAQRYAHLRCRRSVDDKRRHFLDLLKCDAALFSNIAFAAMFLMAQFVLILYVVFVWLSGCSGNC